MKLFFKSKKRNEPMKLIKLLLFSVVLIVIAGRANSEAPLFHFSAKDMGITEFDLTVQEIERKERVSILNIAGFHQRPASGSRWLMCAYTALAIERGFKYWVILYPEKSSEKLVIGFPKTPTENLAETLSPVFANEYLGPVSINTLTELCGLTDYAKFYNMINNTQ